MTVEVVYEKKPDKCNVTVENGKMSTGKISGTVQVSKLVTVKTNAASSCKLYFVSVLNALRTASLSRAVLWLPATLILV